MEVNYNKRYTDRELERMPIKVAYDLVCNGKFYTKFHSTFWNNITRPRENANILLRHVYTDIIKCELDKLPSVITREHFKVLRLESMLDTIYGGSIAEAFTSAFPNQFNKFQFKETFMKEYTLEECDEAIRWFLKDKLKYSLDDCMKKLSPTDFMEYNLTYLFGKIYDSDVSKVVAKVYGDEFLAYKNSLRELAQKYSKRKRISHNIY